MKNNINILQENVYIAFVFYWTKKACFLLFVVWMWREPLIVSFISVCVCSVFPLSPVFCVWVNTHAASLTRVSSVTVLVNIVRPHTAIRSVWHAFPSFPLLRPPSINTNSHMLVHSFFQPTILITVAGLLITSNNQQTSERSFTLINGKSREGDLSSYIIDTNVSSPLKKIPFRSLFLLRDSYDER